MKAMPCPKRGAYLEPAEDPPARWRFGGYFCWWGNKLRNLPKLLSKGQVAQPEFIPGSGSCFSRITASAVLRPGVGDGFSLKAGLTRAGAPTPGAKRAGFLRRIRYLGLQRVRSPWAPWEQQFR